MQRKTLILPLLTTAILTGCDLSLDLEASDTTPPTEEELRPAIGGEEINYGVSYPNSAQSSIPIMDDFNKAQAYFDVFNLVQKHETFLKTMQSTLVSSSSSSSDSSSSSSSSSSASSANTTTTNPVVVDGKCGGSRSLTNSDNATTSVVDRRLAFSNYCNENADLDTHVRENGVVTVYGSSSNYNQRFYDYRLQIEHEYQASIGGEIYVSPTTTDYTINYKDVAIKLDTLNLIAKYEDFKSTKTETGSIFTGYFYHPTYGKAHLRTLQGQRITTAVSQGFDIAATGQLQIYGANDTFARVSFIDKDSYNLELDTNGDGVVDSSCSANPIRRGSKPNC